MKILAAFLMCSLLFGATVPAGADVGGAVLQPTSGTLGVNSPAGVALIEAWNDTETPTTSFTYGADCFGFPYTPAQSYPLVKIDFYAGDLPGTVTVSVLADDGSGLPTGPVLASVTYQETSPRRWQGAELVPAINLTAGTLYYVRYQVVVGAECSFGDAGVVIPHAWSFSNCVSWDGFGSFYPWMARFYSDVITPGDSQTWGRIKTLYR
jgi:hypothetical protein